MKRKDTERDEKLNEYLALFNGKIMPKVWLYSTGDYSILVWQSLEPLKNLLEKAVLSAEEHAKWDSFISKTRKREWLTVRIAIRELLPELPTGAIRYDENGKPHLPDHSISISHSNDFIALMISRKGRIGIDIEVIDTRIERLSQKFLSENEKQYGYSAKHIEKLHVMWGAKEVLYKIHGTGGMEFKSDLLVHPFIFTGSGKTDASILKSGYEKKYTIHYFQLHDYMLTWAIEI